MRKVEHHVIVESITLIGLRRNYSEKKRVITFHLMPTCVVLCKNEYYKIVNTINTFVMYHDVYQLTDLSKAFKQEG